MYFSKFFVPTTREDPSDADLISHKQMIKSGMIKKTAAGIYNWLPLGLMIMRNVEQIVRKKIIDGAVIIYPTETVWACLLYTSPSPRD